MRLFIVACALFTVAAGAALPGEATAQITDYENNNDGSGNYYFRFKTSNGITREEWGHLINAGTEEEYVRVEGTYTYINTDGIPVVTNYTGDQNGYHQNGDDKPQLPGGDIVAAGVPPNIAATLLGK